MSDIAYFAKNTLIIAISKISTHIIAFVMLPIYTRTLSTSEYGLMDIILTYTALLAPLLLANLNSALFRFFVDVRDNKKEQSRVFTNAINIMIPPVMVFLFAAAILTQFVNTGLVMAVSLYFLGFMFMEVISQSSRGLGDNKLFALSTLAQGVLSTIFSSIALLVFQGNLVGLFLALALAHLLPAAYVFFKLRIGSLYDVSLNDKTKKKELLNYSLPLIPNSISWWIFNASDRTFLYTLVSAAANGIYAVSNKFSGVLFNVWGIFYIPLTESVSLTIDKNNRDAFLDRVFSITVRIFLAITSLGIIFTSAFFPILVDASFVDAYRYIPVLMLAGFLNCILGFYSTIYIAKKLTKQIMKVSIWAAAINVAVMLALVGSLGIWAAAVSTLVAFATTTIHRHIDMRQRGFNFSIDKIVILQGLSILFLSILTYYFSSSQLVKTAILLVIVVMSAYLNKDSLSYLKKTFMRTIGSSRE